MKLTSIKNRLDPCLYDILNKRIKELRPCQAKAIEAGLLDGKSLLVCTPTASGKTLIGEIAALNAILKHGGKALYIVPLKALANQKFHDFKRDYEGIARIALSVGDIDSADPYLMDYDLIISTSEKVDSLIRHHAPWLPRVAVAVIDEIHLLDDPGRGPTLEILITLMRLMLKRLQLIGLSATIGNPEELASWLNAGLVVDNWRPVKLKRGIYLDGEVEFY
ncbi:hypothetical protein COV22_00465, partial [Candidatus Woesearchaeota archaeon CG10_big_fil_rev_8_21_14_0_10_47_5]